MSGPARRESFYLTGSGDPVFCTRHDPPPDAVRPVSVLICPPFGWEEVCSYRSLRVWADRLAGAGYLTLRLSLPSTGDSAGAPEDPGRVEAWVAAVSDAAAWLSTSAPGERVVALGIGLGGMVAHLAAAAGARIDDLALWGVPARGRALLRQLRAFSKLEQEIFFESLPAPPPLPSGELEAGGFWLSAETTATLEQVDLRRYEIPVQPGRRALVLERDGVPPDAGLVESLERSGLKVELAPGEGFGEMTAHPQLTRAPVGTIETMLAWLQTAPACEPRQPRSMPTTAGSVQLTGDPADSRFRETVLTIPSAAGPLAAVLTEPMAPDRADVCVVLLNPGAVRRIGPNRTWVEASRRWAAAGIPSLRLDVEGIGDADGGEELYRQDADLYDLRFVDQIRVALDDLQRRGVATRFVLAGLCASAFWSLQCALIDPRVSGAIFLNLRAIVWHQDLGPARDLRALISQPPSLARFRRAATRERVGAFLRWLLGAPLRLLRGLRRQDHRHAAPDAQADVLLRSLLGSDRRLLFLFSEHEPLYDEFARSGRLAWLEHAPGATLETIAVRDHTMRPVWAQAQLHAAMDRALARDPGVDGRLAP